MATSGSAKRHKETAGTCSGHGQPEPPALRTLPGTRHTPRGRRAIDPLITNRTGGRGGSGAREGPRAALGLPAGSTFGDPGHEEDGKHSLAPRPAGLPLDTDGMGIQKKNCTWLLVTHDPCVKGDVMTALKKATGDVVFKFEPFVLHVLCRELQDAQLLHSVAIDSGFRNSGITVGRGGKITMAVRSTHCLEVPLSHKGRLMVSEEYIEFLVHVANQKMEENRKRIDRFHKGLELALEAAVPADTLFPEGLEKSHSVYMHRRKRRTAQEQADPSRELEPQDDTESSLGLFAEIMI
ncbi:tRNA wybutosine-synthesizing protein 3 homolog [Geospiza fortis]|uniref:tRNA wybutosine-synthesizing protein 3 homolog n=1 Tax=Geospiza fortis TaxID=48883 RepID=A0A6I9HTR7_GEOFO|nr:tRNA wybutosine-synthesizing protein 3 homolog [Geospiza fortis]